jgi:hypothetical protein
MATDRGRALDPGHVSEFEEFLLASRRRTLPAVLPPVHDFAETEDVVHVGLRAGRPALDGAPVTNDAPYAGLTTGDPISLGPVKYPGYLIRHKDAVARIDPVTASSPALE